MARSNFPKNYDQLVEEQTGTIVEVFPQQLSGDEGADAVKVKPQVTKANFLFTVTTIIKTVIGAGIIIIPYTMQTMGCLLGILGFVAAGLMTYFGSSLMLEAKNMSRHSNYFSILYYIWQSPWAKVVGLLNIWLATVLACIAHLIIFKTTIRKLWQDLNGDPQVMASFYTQQYFIVIVIAILETPFTLAPQIQKLKYLAFIGVGGIALFVLVFTIYYISAVLSDEPIQQPIGGMRMWPQSWFTAASAVPNILASLGFQINLFPIYKGMKDVSDVRMMRAVLCAIVFCCGAYVVVGIMGYDLVGNNIKSNFLQSLNYQIIPQTIFFLLNGCFLVSIFCAFPLMFFGCRNNLVALLNILVGRDEVVSDQGIQATISEQQDGVQVRCGGRLMFVGCTVLAFMFVVGISLWLDDIQIIINTAGAIAITAYAILLPCLFYFRLIVIKNRPKTWLYYLSMVIFAVMIPYSLFSIVALYVHPQ